MGLNTRTCVNALCVQVYHNVRVRTRKRMHTMNRGMLEPPRTPGTGDNNNIITVLRAHHPAVGARDKVL